MPKTRKKLVTYPTGVKYWREELRNESGSLRIEVEQYAGLRRGAREPLLRESIGDCSVSGSIILRGEDCGAFIRHNSLPVATFTVRNWGGPKTAHAQAIALARKWFRQLRKGAE